MKVNHTPMFFWRLIASLSLAIVTSVVFLPSLENGFVGWDDNTYVFENRVFLSKDFDLWSWLFKPALYRDWHPVTMFTFGLDYSLWGLNPLAYHLTSVIFHTLNVLLLFLLVFRIIQRSSASSDDVLPKKYLIAPFVTALLWGIHPLRVEPVAWISGRKELLCAFFFLLSIDSYIRYVYSDGIKKWFFLFLSLFLFIISVLSKPVTAILPGVLLVLDFFALKRINSLRDVKIPMLEKVPFLLLSTFSIYNTIAAYRSVGALLTFSEVPLIDRIVIAANSCFFYIYKMIFPANLVPYYPFSRNIEILDYRHLGSIFVFLIITAMSIYLIRRAKAFSAIWLFYLITLLPISGVIQSGVPVAADRYTYIPSMGWSLLAGLGVGNIIDRFQRKGFLSVIWLALVIISGILLVKTVRQIDVWQDTITLWSHEIDIYPKTAEVAYNNRGNEYNRIGDYKQAIRDLDRSIEINSSYYQAYNNRGNSYFNLGHYNQSISDYTKAIGLNSAFAEAYYNRGNAYIKLERFAEAMEDLNKAIELDPGYALSYNNRGIIYDRLGNYEKAISDFSKAIELDPQFAGAYYNIGMVYAFSNKKELARINFKKAQELGLK